jgi:GT2 family glycosyltransferase
LSRPLVSVVILSYSRPDHLRRAIESVADQSYPSLDTIVVDNKSPGSDAIARIVSASPRVRFIANDENLGFAGGMNVGIAAASGEYVYLTEDDVLLRPGCLSAMVDYVERHPDAGLVAPVMYDQSSGSVRSAGGRFALEPVFNLTIITERTAGQGPQPFDVMYVPGASILARTSLLKSVNGFRDDYFLYQEDLELCIRMMKAGYRVVTVPAAGVDHIDPPPGPASNMVEYFRIRNLFRTYVLHAPARVLPGFFLRYGVIDFSRTVIQNPGRARLIAKAWLSVAASLPRLLRERDNRPLDRGTRNPEPGTRNSELGTRNPKP